MVGWNASFLFVLMFAKTKAKLLYLREQKTAKKTKESFAPCKFLMLVVHFDDCVLGLTRGGWNEMVFCMYEATMLNFK
jgi:hypothetical protein